MENQATISDSTNSFNLKSAMNEMTSKEKSEIWGYIEFNICF